MRRSAPRKFIYIKKIRNIHGRKIAAIHYYCSAKHFFVSNKKIALYHTPT